MLKVSNSMALASAFESTGLKVSEAEDECLQLRNVALHGNSAMVDLELDSLKSEIQRVDVLRTLVAKAVLKLIEYEGPYCDYGAQPLQCTIKQMTSDSIDQ